MSAKTTSAELSLINDSEFLAELEKFQAPAGRDSGFAALETGLPMTGGDLSVGEPFDESYGSPHADPNTNPYDAPFADEAAALSEEKHVPLIAAALILAVCVSAGAATAAYVFHDQLARIIAPRAATR